MLASSVYLQCSLLLNSLQHANPLSLDLSSSQLPLLLGALAKLLLLRLYVFSTTGTTAVRHVMYVITMLHRIVPIVFCIMR